MDNLRTILHPTDFSDSAQPALELAKRLAEFHGARLILLHVASPPVLYGEMGMTIPLPDTQQKILAEQHAALERLAPPSPSTAPAPAGAERRYPCECRVEEGVFATEIVRLAREESCDLIVMGTHGRGGLARLLLGSVATQVLREAPCPVLAVKPRHAAKQAGAVEAEAAAAAQPGGPARPLFPVILHPTDFSGRARHAFDIAATLAQAGGRLVVLHVVEAVHVASEGFTQALEERLHSFQPPDPSVQVEYHLREGEPAEEVLAEAAATRCDLIALGTHGRTGLDRLIMGSLAEAVLRRAVCPVLVVKAPEHAPPTSPASPLASTLF